MTSHDELRAFAQALDPFCRRQNLRFACLQAEHDLEPTPRWALAPYLFLTQLAEELACGHLVSTAQGSNFFIRVRTPFVATPSLKFVVLRTYSLILVTPRGLKHTRFERDLSPAAAHTDPHEILAQATQAATATLTSEQACVQPEQSAPFQTKNPELLACRATFATGVEIGTVLVSSTDNSGELSPSLLPSQFYPPQ